MLAAYYCPEPRSVRVEAALRKLDGPCLSWLVELELHSAVAQKLRLGEIDAPSANRIVSRFTVHLDEGSYRVLPVGAPAFAMAKEWIARFATPLRTLDALHLAVAFSADLCLWTSDRSLAGSAETLGVSCRLFE